MCASVSAVNVKGPTKALTVDVATQGDTLFYEFARGKKALITQSPMVVNINNEYVKWQIVSDEKSSVNDKFDMLTGESSTVELKYTQNSMILKGVTSKGESVDGELIVRVYDRAMAYRFIVDLDKESSIRENSAYCVPSTNGKYFATNGENPPAGPLSAADIAKARTAPILYMADDYVLGLHEADLHNYPQLMVKGDKSGKFISIATGNATRSGRVELPWRVIFEGDEISDLHNSKSVYLSLSQEADGDFSWVKPGRSTWDWRVKGTTFNGVKYDMTTNSLKRYIDFCAKNNVEYFLIDDEWYPNATPLVPVKGLDLKEVIRYGLDKGVGTLVYYDLKYMGYTEDGKEIDFDEVVRTLASWGAKGIKYGFLGSQGTKYNAQQKVVKSVDVVATAAKHKLIVFFHDGPVPFGGLERQYPNYISREFCHAQMDSRRSFSPDGFVKMACVNLLAGPMDQTNGTYALNTIAERSKGPRNEYNSTVSSETARFLITHTGNMSILLDAPEAYEQKSDLFNFISRMPSRWDEVKYLEMDYNHLISVARRNGSEWFVGTVFNEKGGDHSIKLDFIEKGKKYKATIYSDAKDTNYKNNKESYVVSSKEVVFGETITTTVVDGGGYSILLEQL